MRVILRSAALWLVILVLCLWGVAALAAISGSFLPTVIAGNGATVSWGYGYPFFAPSDLAVTLKDASGNPVTVTLNGGGTYDYAISGTLNQAQGEYTAGGTVTFNTAPPAGYTGLIQPAVPPVQPAVFSDYAPLPAKGLEGVLDRQIVVIQQLQAQLASVVSSGLPSCPNNSVLGNVSGVSAAPVCLTSASLSGLTLGALTVNKGTGTPPALASGIVAELVGATASTARVELDGWAGSALYTALRIDGSPAGRAALGSAETIGGVNGWGWNGSAAYGPAASFDIATTEAWSAGHGGAQACIKATPSASVTLETEACFQAGLVAGTPTGGAKGLGSVNASTLWLNGAALTSAATTAIGTSGATLPLLNGANAWSGTQTFAVAGGVMDLAETGLHSVAANTSFQNGVAELLPSFAQTGATNTSKLAGLVAGLSIDATNTQAISGTITGLNAKFGVNSGAAGTYTFASGLATQCNNSSATATVTSCAGLQAMVTVANSGVITNAVDALLVSPSVGATNNIALLISSAVTVSRSGTWSIDDESANYSYLTEGLVIGTTTTEGAGTINVANGYWSGGTAGLASKSCAFTTGNVSTGITLTIKGGLVTGTTTC